MEAGDLEPAQLDGASFTIELLTLLLLTLFFERVKRLKCPPAKDLKELEKEFDEEVSSYT